MIENEDDLAELDSSGPFGDPDASRVEFQTLKASFVSMSNSERKNDETLGADASVRVVVGRRGSGKTLYLRSIQNYCRNLNVDGRNVYTTNIDNQPPDTSLIVRVTSWYQEKDSDADEVWRRLWKLAILRAVYTHLFLSETFTRGDKALVKYLKGRHAKFQKDYERVAPRNKTPSLVFAQLTSLLKQFNSQKDLHEFIYAEEWADFENEIADILRRTQPFYFFIDQLDDDFANAPYHWLKCQLGLFNAIFRFIRNDSFGGKLHIVACIREVVYSYILQSQHGNKYLSEPKIKVLRWDKKLSRHFLEKKIESLADRYFVSKSSVKSVEAFFGVDNVRLTRRNNMLEEIRSYVLRHTMLLPREIINIGNIFCEEQRMHEFPEQAEKAVKQTVSRVAKLLAREQLKMASILISNRWIYNGAVEQGTLNVFSDESMLNSIQDQLCDIILEIGVDRFDNKVLKRIEKNKNRFGFGPNDEPLTALFRVGLLGYLESDADGRQYEVFFSESRKAQFRLPTFCSGYVFHSCLIDDLGIEPIGEPVRA